MTTQPKNTTPSPPLPRGPRLKALLKTVLLILLLFPLSIILLLAWLISTETGFHMLLTQAQRWAPGELKIQSYQGRLLDQFSLTGLSYQYQDFAIEIASCQWAWDATALWHRTVHLTQWHLSQVVIHLPKSKETDKKDTAPLELPSVQLPVQLALDDVQFSQITLYRPDSEPLEIENLTLRSTTTDTLELHQFQLQSKVINATAAGKIGLQPPHVVQLHWEGNAKLAQPAVTITGQGEINGDMQKLQVNTKVSQPFAVQLNSTVYDILIKDNSPWREANSTFNLNTLRVNTDLTWEKLYWPITSETPVVNSTQGHFTFSGTPEDYQLNLETHLTGQQIPKGFWQMTARGSLQALNLEKLYAELLQGKIEATGKVAWQPQLTAQLQFSSRHLNLQDLWKDWPAELKLNSQLEANLKGEQFQVNQLQINLPPTATQVSLQGEGFLTDHQPQFKSAELSWQNLQWPLLNSAPQASSSAGRLHFSGSPEEYRFDLFTQVAGPQIPAGQWNLIGQGNLQQVTLEKLQATVLNGNLQGFGEVHWQPTLVAQVNLRTERMNLAPFWKQWPVNLGLNSQLVAKLEGDHLTIDQLAVSLPPTSATLSLQGTGSLADQQNPSFNTTLTWNEVQWPLAGAPTVAHSPHGQLTVKGSVQDYQLNLDTVLSATKFPPSQLRLTGGGNLQQVDIKSLQMDTLQGLVTATGQVRWQPSLTAELSLNAKEINLTEVSPQWPRHLTLNTQLVAHWQDATVKVPQWTLELPHSKLQLRLQGEANLADKQPQFQTTLTWEKLQWPLESGDATPTLVSSPRGQLSVAGTPLAYQLQFDTQVQGKDIPSGQWQAAGEGDLQGFRFKNLQGEVLQGQLNLTGQVNWQPTISWEVAVQGKQLNPGATWQAWPGQLALDIRSQGQWANGEVDAQLEVKNIQGKLRNYPLQLQTSVGVKGKQYDLPKFQFQSGSARLSAAGTLGSRSKLQWDINVPNLATLLPEAKGSLSGQGQLTGPLGLPNVTARLTGNSLAFQDKQMNSVQAQVELHWEAGKSSQLNLLARGMRQGDTVIEQVQVQGQGDVTKHALQIDARMSPKNQLFLQLEGSLKSAQWQGTLQHLTIAATKLESAFRLQSPVTLKVSSTEAESSPLCLKNSQSARWCTQWHWYSQQASTVQTSLENFSFTLLRPFLSPEANLDLTRMGMLNGKLMASLAPSGILTSEVNLAVSPGVLKTVVAGEMQEFAHQGAKFTMQVNQNGLTALFDWKLLQHSGITGQVLIPQLTRLPLDTRHRLQGQLQVTFDDFSLLPSLVPQVEKTQGKVNLEMRLGGTLAAPLVQGYLRAQEVAADLPVAGLQLRKGEMSLQDQGRNTLQMRAQLSSGAGQVTLQGEAKLLSLTQWMVHLTLSGKNVEVVNLPMVVGHASPQLEIHLSPDGVKVTGQVILPKVAITPPESTEGKISVSKDVVIVRAQKSPTASPAESSPALDPRIFSDVKVILGDQVTFTGMGFNSRITGALRVRGQPGKSTQGQGELLIDGTYKAYGQRLTVEKGRVIFGNGPIENPGLDIRAFRRIYQRGSREVTSSGTIVRSDEEVIAGVHIHGFAKSPQLTLYSKPAVDQSNTLSYIVLGKPIAKASGEEGKTLLGAALAAQLPGADGDDSLTQKIGKQVGLDEATISAEKGVADAALVMGKYLSPELYISYGVGLFDASSVFRIRYQLNQWLTLETETGTRSSGVDLRYRLER